MGRAEHEIREYNKKEMIQTEYKNLPAIMHQIDLRMENRKFRLELE